MISLQKYDIIHNIIMYISDMAYIYIYIYDITMLSIYHEIVYDIIGLAFLARPRNYDIIHDIIIFGMISYMISRSSMISYAF
jgi:hypothetical protein